MQIQCMLYWGNTMRYKLNIQGFAQPEVGEHLRITINGTQYSFASGGDYTWNGNTSRNTFYTISNNKVLFTDGTILQYNGVDVLPTDVVSKGNAYTTRAVKPNYVTWKFNDTISVTSTTSGDLDISNISFISDNVTYDRIFYADSKDETYYQQTTGDRKQTAVYRSSAWVDTKYQIIQVDSNSTDYASFVTWAKANGGVLLEKGTYKWVDSPTTPNSAISTYLNFTSNSSNYIKLSYSVGAPSSRIIDYHDTEASHLDVYSMTDGWTNDAYKTITTTADQYIDYDFYNYAITGEQLVKQEVTPTTGTVKFGTTAPTKYYLGNKAVDRIYMGTVLLYKKAIVYTITANLANCTANSDNPITIEENGGAILYYIANTGYELPDGVELTNVGSYNWDKTTGKLVIARPSGNVTIKIVAKQTMTQLATPQNVSVENTTLSFDEVENAEEYEVFVDNVSIGSYTKPSYILTSDSINPANIEVNGTALTSLPYTLQSGDVIIANLMGMEDSALTVNGVKQTSNNQTFTLTNTNIAIELDSGSFNGPKVTINYQ